MVTQSALAALRGLRAAVLMPEETGEALQLGRYASHG